MDPLATDSYKLSHWRMYQDDDARIHSYFEAREGAKHDEIVFFGLQAILEMYGITKPPTPADIDTAKAISDVHMGPGIFNEQGWTDLLNLGYVPLHIRAVKEGSINAPSDVLVTVQNTVDGFGWLAQHVETLLSHLWYPCTVASTSRAVRKTIDRYMRKTTGSTAGAEFSLHDFGCRGASSAQAAAIGGAAHLLSFSGSDTALALKFIHTYYKWRGFIAGSVPASEHSVMTALGREGESTVVGGLLKEFPDGVLSVVADSYDVYNFVLKIVCRTYFDVIEERDGKFVVRPDSVTDRHPTPAEQVLWILESFLRAGFSFTEDNDEDGFGYINFTKVGVLWGDGIEPADIELILETITGAGFSASNVVFGMGGGLLQKVNRDTERFAFKASAVYRDGTWVPISKETPGKQSKAGLFTGLNGLGANLETVFLDGVTYRTQTFTEIRELAARP